MPAPSIKSFAKKHGKSEAEVEKLWSKAKKLAKEEYPDVKEGEERFYKIVTGILKKMLGIKEQTFSGDISVPVPPISSLQKRILPFTDFVKQRNKGQKWRVTLSDGTSKDFDSFDDAYSYYLKMDKQGNEPKKPVRVQV